MIFSQNCTLTRVQIWFLKWLIFLILHFSPSNSFCFWKAKLEKFFTRKEAQAYIQSKQQKNFLLQIDKKLKSRIKRGLPDPSKCVRKHQNSFIQRRTTKKQSPRWSKIQTQNLFDPQVVINQKNSTTVAMIF